nr:deoxyribodipyrimidine photo-lyase [Amaricoccus macauensis]
MGAASRWRLGLALVEHLAESLEKAGSRLVLRRERAEEALPALMRETGATEAITVS